MNLRYENHKGQSVALNDGRYFVSQNDLRSYEWSFEASTRPGGIGGMVRAFTRPASVKTLTLGVRGTREQFSERMNALLALTEPDIHANTPGRLWLGDQYLICYLAVGSELTNYSPRAHFAEKTLKVLVTHPFWFQEETRVYHAGSGAQSPDGKRYANRYPHRYGTGYANTSLLNGHYADTPIVLTVYGPCANPVVSVAGTPYGVETDVLALERVVLDQVRRRIYKVSAMGAMTNLFDYRLKAYDPFKPVPPGESSVAFNGAFSFDLTLMKQRSEPAWT